MKCDIRIMASPKREERAKALARKLGLPPDAITWDDRPGGGDAMYTARKTWLHPMAEGATHRLVLQDDVIVCDGLPEILPEIIESHPRDVLTLITLDWRPRLLAENRDDSPYFPILELPGCAILMPAVCIAPCMAWCESDPYPELRLFDDRMISAWCREQGQRMVAVLPNLVDHPDDGTLLPYQYPWKRSSCTYRQQPMGNWRNPRTHRLCDFL